MAAIMNRAHGLARTMEGDYGARMSIALRQAWAEAKGLAAEPVAEEVIYNDMVAEELGERIRGEGGFIVRVEHERYDSRVHVARSLSRGRRQELGFVEIQEDGTVTYEAYRIRGQFNAWLRWAEERMQGA